MTTLTSFPTDASVRAELSKQYHGALRRAGRRSDRLYPVFQAIGAAIGGSEASVDVDTSGFSRKALSSLMRTVDSIARVTPNASCLTMFACALEAEDAAANPNAGSFRDA